MSTRGSYQRRSNDLIYLVNVYEMQHLDVGTLGDIDADAMSKACDQKIAFMQAFLASAALERPNFETYVRTILRLQSRRSAPRALGFWFWQSDIMKFGAGASFFFQGNKISIFCENPKQLDFSDISSIMPYDCIMVRNPTEKWTKGRVQKLIDHIKWDLAFDGDKTEIGFHQWNDLLFLDLMSPDYGIGMRTKARP